MKLKRTKIIATLGPASDTEEVIEKLILAGTDIFRLNASHCKDPEDIRAIVRKLRQLSKKMSREISLFLDLQGPKIRIGRFINDKEQLSQGDIFCITSDQSCQGDKSKVSTSYPQLIEDLRVGDPIYIDDGNIRMEVVEKNPKEVLCKVTRGGVISNNKGINLPLTPNNHSVLTEKDLRDLKTAIEEDIEMVALSFVSTKKDVERLREKITEFGGSDISIIAKIERRAAVENMTEIITAADAVMVARGDLGVEIGIEKVPETQKQILREAFRLIKPAIVATQMLESMVNKSTATRAEVSDIANAIYDGCDVVMLSGETAMGIDPPNAVTVMNNICKATDEHVSQLKYSKYSQVKRIFEEKTMATSFCKAADQIAEENQADLLLAFTSSGNTPLIASKLNPAIPIIAPTDNIKVLRRMALYRGVIPILLPKPFEALESWGKMISLAIQLSKEKGFMKKGDKLVVTAGIPIGQPGGTNSIRMLDVE